MSRSLLRIGGIVLASAFLAAGHARIRGLPWVPDVQAIRAESEQKAQLRKTAGVDLPRFLDLIEQGAVVIDARTREQFEEGHLAVPPYTVILNIPGDRASEHLNRLESLRGYRFVLYCNDLDCDLAEDLCIAMQRAGFWAEDMFIFFPGWKGIVAAGLETATGPDTWNVEPESDLLSLAPYASEPPDAELDEPPHEGSEVP